MSEQVEQAHDLRAADGRVPGRRGLATRQKLLDCTAEMLRSTSYRSVKVIDIAREAGTSPATFYQYFADVEAAILVLAQEMALDGERLVQLVADGNWKGKAGYQTSLDLTDAFFAFWDQHRPVLRVVDLSTDEGDRRFRNIRVGLLNAVTTELAKVISGLQAERQEPRRRAAGPGGRDGHHARQRGGPPRRLRVLGHPHARRAHLGRPPGVLGHDRPASAHPVVTAT